MNRRIKFVTYSIRLGGDADSIIKTLNTFTTSELLAAATQSSKGGHGKRGYKKPENQLFEGACVQLEQIGAELNIDSLIDKFRHPESPEASGLNDFIGANPELKIKFSVREPSLGIELEVGDRIELFNGEWQGRKLFWDRKILSNKIKKWQRCKNNL